VKKRFNPKKNYEKTRSEIGYVTRKKATPDDYKRIGFKSGLEVHQQLKTKKKVLQAFIMNMMITMRRSSVT